MNQLKEGDCDIKNVGPEYAEFIQILTCPNPSKRPTTETIKQQMKKFLPSIPQHTSETDYSLSIIDLVGTPPDFAIDCPVCLQILQKPLKQSCCGKSICELCIQKLYDKSHCPCCKQSYTSVHDKDLEKSLDKLALCLLNFSKLKTGIVFLNLDGVGK